MKFKLKKNLTGWEGWTELPLASATVEGAAHELAHVGLDLGRDGLLIVK